MPTFNYSVGSLTNNSYTNSTILNDHWTADTYQFSVDNPRSIDLNLHNISEGDDADLSLYSDSDNNGQFDPSIDTYLAGSFNGGNSDDTINDYSVEAGTYFAQVKSYNLGDDNSLNYTFDLSPASQTVNFDLNFETNGQNLWGAGNAASFGDERFLGWDWNESGSSQILGETEIIPEVIIVPEICIPFVGCTPAVTTPGVSIPSLGVSGSTNGRVGLQSDLDLNGGSVNASLPIDVWFDIPESVQPGETITIRSGFSLSDDATFSTTSPTGSYELDLVFGLGAGAGVAVGSSNYNLFGVNIPQQQVNLLDLDPSDLTYSYSGDYGSAQVSFPVINTQGSLTGSNTLSAQGSDDFFNGALDLDYIATSLLGIPPLEAGFSEGFSVLGFGLGVNGEYNLLDVELAPSLNASQAFNLTLDDLTGQLILENGEQINFVVGQDVSLTVPDGVGESLEIDALINPEANFSNTTALGYDVDFEIEALSVNGGVDIGPFSPGFDLGPVVDESFSIINGDIDVYNQTFDLGGWNSAVVEFEIGIA